MITPSETTEIPDTVAAKVARARFYADLLTLTADENRRLAGDDPSPVAVNLLDTATRKEAEATINLDLAEATEEHARAKVERNANPTDERALRNYAYARDRLVELRTYWRSIDEAVGNRRAAATLDHFDEPSDDELLGKVN